MKTKNALDAKSAVLETLQFLLDKGYRVIPHGNENWEKELESIIHDKEITNNNYFFDVELAPVHWPYIDQHPLSVEDNPYNGVYFSISCQRVYSAEKVSRIPHKHKERLMKEYSLTESDLFSLWNAQIKHFPLFSLKSDILDSRFTETLENARAYILEIEQKLEQYLTQQA